MEMAILYSKTFHHIPLFYLQQNTSSPQSGRDTSKYSRPRSRSRSRSPEGSSDAKKRKPETSAPGSTTSAPHGSGGGVGGANNNDDGKGNESEAEKSDTDLVVDDNNEVSKLIAILHYLFDWRLVNLVTTQY